MRNLALLVVTVVTFAGCSTSSGWPTTGTVWIRNETASRVNVEVITNFGGWFPSAEDATIAVDAANGDYCNQTAAVIGSGPVTIRVSGAAVAVEQMFSFTQPQPAATMPRAALDYTLDVDPAGHAFLAHGEPPASWVCPGQSAGAPSAPPSTTVPALTVQEPTVRVSPSMGLHDGESVTVAVTGFGVGAKVWLSECASATDVSGEGCGAQLAAQTLLATGDDRSGSTTFVVHDTAATEPVQAEPTATCSNDCVIVATQGGGYGDAWAAISFGP